MIGADLAENRTAKERAILDEVFVLTKQKAGAAPAYVMVRVIIASLIETRWLAAFGKN